MSTSDPVPNPAQTPALIESCGQFHDTSNIRMTAEQLGYWTWREDAHDFQIPELQTDQDWSTWLFLGGRGSGKTRAGSEWVWDQALSLGEGGRIALVAPTHHDARSVMIEGPSGLLSLPHRQGAIFEPSLRRVRFPGGALAMVFSAEEPERLRGPQFHCGWGDELCAWTRAEETLAMLRLGLRLGDRPRLTLTSTPKPRRWLRRLMAERNLAESRAATGDNAAHLAPGFEAAMRALYGGARREAQELDGRVLDPDGALFTAEMIAAARASGRLPRPRDLRVVVAVDPPAGTLDGHARDACGIVAAARSGDHYFVLADRSLRGRSPSEWAARVRVLAEEVSAERIVAETNQGGAMVETVLKGAGLRQPVRRVHAILSKSQRAEPVAALYEQGRVSHAPGLDRLEEELMGLGDPDVGGPSPDRADALVWAVTALMTNRPGPRIRGLW